MLWKYYLMAGEFVGGRAAGGRRTNTGFACCLFIARKLPSDYTVNDKFAINKKRIGRPPPGRVSDFGFLILNICTAPAGYCCLIGGRVGG